jgi:hypothetical protein
MGRSPVGRRGKSTASPAVDGNHTSTSLCAPLRSIATSLRTGGPKTSCEQGQTWRTQADAHPGARAETDACRRALGCEGAPGRRSRLACSARSPWGLSRASSAWRRGERGVKDMARGFIRDGFSGLWGSRQAVRVGAAGSRKARPAPRAGDVRARHPQRGPAQAAATTRRGDGAGSRGGSWARLLGCNHSRQRTSPDVSDSSGRVCSPLPYYCAGESPAHAPTPSCRPTPSPPGPPTPPPWC